MPSLPDLFRRSFGARLQAPPHDRRVQRLEPPPCSACGVAAPQVVSRTDYVVYLRCGLCGHVWSMPKPGQQGFGT